MERANFTQNSTISQKMVQATNEVVPIMTTPTQSPPPPNVHELRPDLDTMDTHDMVDPVSAEPQPHLPTTSASSRHTQCPATAGRCGVRASSNAARERSRVKTLRTAFLELQRTLPAVPRDTKLSKLDVLVLATTYIANLTTTLAKSSPGEFGFAR